MPPKSTVVEGIPVTLQSPQPEPGEVQGTLPPGKKPTKALHKTGAPPSRWSLRMSANWWRTLEATGMTLHFMAHPRPPNPNFVRAVTCTMGTPLTEGKPKKSRDEFKMHVYTPEGYDRPENKTKRYPAVVNFHGGGFTIGAATDDARFARVVLETCEAVFISVAYRLAPEHPFPAAVEDGADALLYVIRHANELRIDPMKLATSGFSAGGNIALTAPMRLAAFLKGEGHEHETAEGDSAVDVKGAKPMPVPKHKILAAAPWYPITDYTISRAKRRASSKYPDKCLPTFFTDLFDASYLYPPDLDLRDPYLSPSRASDDQLKDGLPEDIIFYTCEWDMLLREGEDLANRLKGDKIGKRVHYKMIEGVPHGWDKSPNPVSPADQAEGLYKECCGMLKDIFQGSSGGLG